MTESKTNFEGIYSSAERPKRQQEVLERAQAGVEVKRIAADLGITRGAVQQIIEGLRTDGRLTQDTALTAGR
jgi:DNA-binding NarL/FixJ family response regulator